MGYVLANNESDAQAVAMILYDSKPEYYSITVTHLDSGIQSVKDLKGKTFAFGDKGLTSGYLIPLHYFMQLCIEPNKYFGKVVYTRPQAIEMQVIAGQLEAGADDNRNRNVRLNLGSRSIPP